MCQVLPCAFAVSCKAVQMRADMSKGYLEVLPEQHDVGHVNLIESSQHGIGVLCTLEALCNTGAQSGHLHPPLGPPWLACWLV